MYFSRLNLKNLATGLLHFRDNWGWPSTAVRMCSHVVNLFKQKVIFLLPWHYTTI